MANRVSGRSAIVTGAARGIGRAVAMRLAQEGADVLVNTRDPKTLEAVYEDEIGRASCRERVLRLV